MPPLKPRPGIRARLSGPELRRCQGASTDTRPAVPGPTVDPGCPWRGANANAPPSAPLHRERTKEQSPGGPSAYRERASPSLPGWWLHPDPFAVLNALSVGDAWAVHSGSEDANPVLRRIVRSSADKGRISCCTTWPCAPFSVRDDARCVARVWIRRTCHRFCRPTVRPRRFR